MALSEENALVLELGFAIEDPLGLDAVLLARALLRFGQRVPPENRREVIDFLERASVALMTVEEATRNQKVN
jgi:hypothetical protein